jgi:DNA replication protein DnaC
MDTARYAQKDCPRCGGRGRIRTGEGITDWAVCPCALFGQRKATAELLIAQTFPGRAREMTLASFNAGELAQNERALLVAGNFVDNYRRAREQGWVLGFWGPPRAGKTHLAVGIAQACAKRYLARAMLLNVPKALRAERERYSNPDLPSPFAQAALVDLLILDDLGAEYERQGDDRSRVSWVTEQLYGLLDERFMHSRPLIYTTNLAPSDMSRRYSSEAWKRVYGRLMQAEVVDPLEIVPVAAAASLDPGAAELLFQRPAE